MLKDIRKYWIIKVILYPLSLLYGFITELRNIFYNHQILKIRQYDIPIISIGNIVAGGTGKTPFTMLCIDLLKNQYENIVIVSRGYGRNSKGLFIVSDGRGHIHPAILGGDEPVMIARKYPHLPVIVAEVRTEGINKAIQEFNADLILLDDAFQHRRLARSCDIVLINGMRSLIAERLLPAGDLREKILNLKRADIIILNKSQGDLSAQDIKFLGRIYSGPVFECVFRPKVLVNPMFQKTDDVSGLKGKTVYIFSAIAGPVQFKNMLIEIGAKVIKVRTYPDHYYYTPSDYEQIINDYQASNCQYLVTTEKDLVKIDVSFFKDLSLVGLGLKGELDNPKTFVDKLNQFIDIKI
jgi:tetraacyldisaccharide 4'-kinase